MIAKIALAFASSADCIIRDKVVRQGDAKVWIGISHLSPRYSSIVKNS